MTASLLPNEPDRLQALYACGVLDTPPDRVFDDLVALACRLCDAPMAMISLIDESRQWFIARVGVEAPETPRDSAFCAHTILRCTPMVVEDALEDPRFRENPLVTGAPGIRFYAGAPLMTTDGFALGALTVMDTRARALTPEQLQDLETLAHQASMHLQWRRNVRQLELAHAIALRDGAERLRNYAEAAGLAPSEHGAKTAA